MKRIFVGVVALMLLLCAAMPVQAGTPLQGPIVKQKRPNVTLPGWAEFNIAADTVNVRVPLRNSDKNTGWYDLAFELWAALPQEAIQEGIETKIIEEKDDQTGETHQVLYAKLLQTGMVKAGQYLQDVTLMQPVSAGTYSAIVYIQPYYVETGLPTQINGGVGIRLNAICYGPDPVQK